MKKLVMAFMLMFGMAHATDFELPPIDLCAELGIGCPGPVGPQGPQGIPGIDGEDGIDGLQGDTGAKGDTGEQGPVGETGETGTTGDTGATGEAGATGETGEQGIAGRDGSDGTDGQDGQDADVEAFLKLRKEAEQAIDFAVDSSAGNTAMAVIDFGSVCAGETAGGIGIGAAHSTFGSSMAGALGVKHGMTDETAIVAKAWGADSDSYGGGLGLVHKF